MSSTFDFYKKTKNLVHEFEETQVFDTNYGVFNFRKFKPFGKIQRRYVKKNYRPSLPV